LNAVGRDYAFDNYVMSVLIAPQQHLPILAVGWSLEHEILFYLLFGVTLALGKRKLITKVLFSFFVVGLVVRLIIFDGHKNDFWDFHITSPVLIEFLAGVLVYGHKEKLSRINPFLILTIGILSFLMLAWWFQGAKVALDDSGLFDLSMTYIRSIWSSVSFGLILAGSLGLEQRVKTDRSSILSFFALIGSASYALYLSHIFVFSAVGQFFKLLKVDLDRLSAVGLVVIGFAIAIAIAIAFLKFIEMPIQRVLHTRSTKRRLQVSCKGTKI